MASPPLLKEQPMPELPEVEITRRGIAPHVVGQRVARVVVRNPKLRYGVPKSLAREFRGQTVDSVERRGKYLLLLSAAGTMMVHLGMSGNLRYLAQAPSAGKHDHVDVVFENGACLRLHDPRRFGSVLWLPQGEAQHKLLATIGPEPLSDEFNGEYLLTRSRGRSTAVKNFIMDSGVVAGVGNIYANEALFMAGIHPLRAAGRISIKRYRILANEIKCVLQAAIESGGSTLRDFVNSDGKPGYFAFKHKVYGRGSQACQVCGAMLKLVRLGQRATVYCSRCQR